MKYLSIIALFLLLVSACTNNRELIIEEHESATQEDSITYELIVLDPGFDSWFALHGTLAKSHTQTYSYNFV